jgi:signal-transduction protein with cAMP-binding, CBS, and nucleotidyltransferase domain
MAITTELNKSRLFADLSAADIAIIVGACEERLLMAGEELFTEGAAGDSIWIIHSGRVEVYKNIRGDVDRTLASLGPGEIIGEMSFIDQSRRSAGARTSEASEFLLLSAEAFRTIQADHPAIAAAFYRNIASILAARVRNTNDLYRESVAFSIEATGAGSLNLIALSEELKPVTINLASGTNVSGRLLQMDHSPAGYTLVVKEKSGKLAIIPYHAIQRIELE